MTERTGTRWNRKLFQFQTHLHVKDKTQDFDLKTAKTRVSENKKLYKEILHNAEILEIQANQPLMTLKHTAELVNDQDVHQQLAMIDQVGFENLRENLIIPLKEHIERYDSLQRKIDECHKTRVDMDRHKMKLENLMKRKKRNENRIKDFQIKYETERERYSTLREEIMEATSHFEEERRMITRPIMSSLLFSYTTHLDNVYRSWTSIRRLMEEHPPYLPLLSTNESSHSQESDRLLLKDMNEQKQQKSQKKIIAECIEDFNGEENELTIKKGERITVLNEEGEWYYGKSHGKEGYVPINYVRII